jgi:hypothetical protein
LAVQFALTLAAGGARAADEAPDEETQAGAIAYYAAATERGRIQGAGFNGEESNSLLRLMENGLEPDYAGYEERGAAIFRDNNDAGGSALARFEASDLSEGIMIESMFASSSSILAQDSVFQLQREIFGRLNSCDLRFGYSPVIGPVPTHEAVLQHFADVYAAETAREEARLAALTDQDCAVRFWVVAAASQANPEVGQSMQQKVVVAAQRAMEASPGLTMERLGEVVQREGQAYAQRLTTPEVVSEVQRDVQFCEGRYGLPLTFFPNP